MTGEVLIGVSTLIASLALLTKNIRHIRCCCISVDQDTERLNNNLDQMEQLVKETRRLATPRNQATTQSNPGVKPIAILT